MNTVKRFEDLLVWQRARLLCNRLFLFLLGELDFDVLTIETIELGKMISGLMKHLQKQFQVQSSGAG